MAEIRITDDIAINDSELEESFVLSTGPGGQNVNKVASAVQLRFDAAYSPSLTPEMRARLASIAGKKLTKSGELILIGRRFRSQEQNRADVRARLIAILSRAATPPRPRRKTRPPPASRRKRLDHKTARGKLKRLRANPRED
ncbi:MAG TPA: alternative ribosome rescue aminoacyl-tRNA hydrolase ArfB [Rhizomicrobium sp.]|jgi:ribosome-associated protein